MNTLAQKMLTYMDQRELFVEGAPVVLMLSGGGDSVALLHLLKAAEQNAASPMPITAMHINHRLRGVEADADEDFCRTLCAELDVPLEVRSLDVAAYAGDHKLNLEDAGRILRYREAETLLDEMCDKHQASHDDGRIVTAHTRDDRVENFFTRAIFGSGLGGLAGMAAQRGRIVRPLLDCDRKELRDFLSAGGHAWREDPSNDDESRTRAFIRLNIVPQAEKLRPNFRENLARTMDLVADDDRLLTDMAQGFARSFSIERSLNESISLDARMMLTLDPIMARRVLRYAITQTFDDASRLDAMHTAAILEGLDLLRKIIDSGDRPPPRKVLFARDIPPALRVKINCDTIEVARI